MSEPKWTEDQRAAIDLQGNLLVAAAAGSGKTAVLVERLIHRITDPAYPSDVDRFLVVTFTKAAAAEMKERVTKALEDAVLREPDSLEAERLLRQLNLLTRSNITTLHSFCLEIIRRYFFRLDLDPSFRVADEAEIELLRQDVAEEVLEQRFAHGAPAFLTFADAFGSDRDVQPLLDLILDLYRFAWSQPDPQDWLQALPQSYRWLNLEALMASPWGKAVEQQVSAVFDAAIQALTRASELAGRPGGPRHYLDVLNRETGYVFRLQAAWQQKEWELTQNLMAGITFGKLPGGGGGRKKKAPDEQADVAADMLKTQAKSLRDQAKLGLQKLRDELFAWPWGEQLRALAGCGAMLATLVNTVLEFSGAYTATKSKRNVLDFSDLEHLALRLLEHEGGASLIARDLRASFEEVMVDEYQDINPVQEKILSLVTPLVDDIPRLFMVGDVKQSIYRFRMADPGLFLQKYGRFSRRQVAQGAVSPQQLAGGVVIDLNRNFRSRRQIIDGVNFLFGQVMTPGVGEVLYDAAAALQYGAGYIEAGPMLTAGGPIEVHLFDPDRLRSGSKVENGSTEPQNDDQANGGEADPGFETGQLGLDLGGGETAEPETGEEISLEDLETVRLEARLVARRIHRLVEGTPEQSGPEFQVWDKQLKGYRPVRYADIVVLLRSYSSVAPVYLEELQRAGVPVYGESSAGYFGAGEVEIMLSLLKIIDNPRRDIPLAAVLRSPLVGLDGRELGRLRSLWPRGDFYEAIVWAAWAGGPNRPDEQTLREEVHYLTKTYKLDEDMFLGRVAGILRETDGLPEKMARFWLTLQRWRSFALSHSLAELLDLVYRETGFLAYVGTLPGGTQRQANLKVLYDRARRFETTHYRGLFRFLRFLDRFREQGKDLGNARRLDDTENVVSLITVHASKGLEFPVVFLAGLGNRFNRRGLNKKLLLHAGLGAGIPVIDGEHAVVYPSVIRYAVRRQLEREALAEEMRVLYVALTRAKERLFLYGRVPKLDKTVGDWLEAAEWPDPALPENLLASADCFLDWIGPALARHPGVRQCLMGMPAEQMGTDEQVMADSWKIVIHQEISPAGDPEEVVSVLTAVAPAENGLTDAMAAEREHWRQVVKARLDWRYPFNEETVRRAKTSVSEIKHRLWLEEAEGAPVSAGREFQAPLSGDESAPEALQGHRKTTSTRTTISVVVSHGSTSIRTSILTAAQRGTVLHTVVQHLPLRDWAGQWDSLNGDQQTSLVDEFVMTLFRREILTAEEMAAVPADRLVTLLNSGLGKRLRQSGDLQREVPFTVAFQPPGLSSPVLVQGVIDALLFYPDETVEILDYKSDSLGQDYADPVLELKQRYTLQLAFYSLAVERLIQLPVSRCTLYSFSLGREVDVTAECAEAKAQGLETTLL